MPLPSYILTTTQIEYIIQVNTTQYTESIIFHKNPMQKSKEKKKG